MATPETIARLHQAFRAQEAAKTACAKALHEAFTPGSEVSWKFAGRIFSGVVISGGAETWGNRLAVRTAGLPHKPALFIRPAQIIDALPA